MSIINNANPGSDLSLVCLIDRELHARKSVPVDLQKLVSALRPDGLAQKESPAQKIPQTLSFWLEQGLWQKAPETSAIYLSREQTDTPLQKRLLETILRNCSDMSGNSVEPLTRVASCLYLMDNFNPLRREPLTFETLVPSINRSMPSYKINESNERKPLLDYCLYLGLMEQNSENRYSADPTRAIEAFLPEIFEAETELSINSFLDRLSVKLPILDGGHIQEWTRLQMEPRQITNIGANSVSASLTYALIRLRLWGKIRVPLQSDDPKAITMQATPSGVPQRVSKIQWLSSST